MNTIERILLLIENHNKNESTIAKECGIYSTAFIEWRKGRSKPSTEAIAKIAKYFNVTTDYLLGFTDIMDRPTVNNEVYNNLDNEKIQLLDDFEKLTRDGKQRVIGYVYALLETMKKQ